MKLSNIGRKLRIFSILCRASEIVNERPNTILLYKKRHLNSKAVSFQINDKFFDLEDDGFKYDRLDVNEESRCGWISIQKIGSAIPKHNNKVRFNQRRNLRSTTIKR